MPRRVTMATAARRRREDAARLAAAQGKDPLYQLSASRGGDTLGLPQAGRQENSWGGYVLLLAMGLMVLRAWKSVLTDKDIERRRPSKRVR
jgi:hypothetical protein